MQGRKNEFKLTYCEPCIIFYDIVKAFYLHKGRRMILHIRNQMSHSSKQKRVQIIFKMIPTIIELQLYSINFKHNSTFYSNLYCSFVVELLYEKYRNYSLKSCGKRFFFCTFVATFYTWNVKKKIKMKLKRGLRVNFVNFLFLFTHFDNFHILLKM